MNNWFYKFRKMNICKVNDLHLKLAILNLKTKLYHINKNIIN